MFDQLSAGLKLAAYAKARNAARETAEGRNDYW